ncbi:MAG: 4Fe-4S binding protein [Gammaproteobacteria bacterium]|nr:4Fe-4S binding protein [Gammaproteobacteria bacterium]
MHKNDKNPAARKDNCAATARISGSTSCLIGLLLMAFLFPHHGYSHDSAPELPADETEETRPADDSSDGEMADEHSDHAQDKADDSNAGAPDNRVRDAQDKSGPAMNKRELGGRGMGGHGLGSHGEGAMTMHHPGLPLRWIIPIVLITMAILGWAIGAGVPTKKEIRTKTLSTMPVIGPVVVFLSASPIPLFFLKLITVCAFILVVIAGFFGTVYPERNLATVLVWNWWWPLVVVSVFFLGSVWCAICPWDAIASWLVRRKLWRRAFPHPGLNRKVPKYLRNVWLALLLLVGLTWLELGIGVTSIPEATAMMGLFMFSLSVIFLVLFERKAFCRYACPVGRTLGFYARLAPIALRPKDQETCATCKTLECYRGSEEVEPCPTSLTIGKFSQNTYCLSCGNCVLSCPYKNVSWRLRTMGSEAMADAKPTWDGAWFMLVLLGITTFHGLTMLPVWTDLVIWIGRSIGETGKLIWSFAFGMVGGFAIPILVYAIAIGATMYIAASRISYKRLFVALPFSTLPLAFTYHLAHNLNHLFREGGGVLALFLNPLGTGLEPMTAMQRHAQMMNRVPEDLLFAMQTGLMLMGVWLAVHILRNRAARILPNQESIVGWRLAPMLVFIVTIAGANLWLLSQDMVMRF